MDEHVEELLVEHARGELDAAERSRVERHLIRCGACRAAREQFARLVADLERTAPEPPPVHWGAYRAELRDKLERRRARGRRSWGWIGRPLPAAAAAGLVAALLYAGLPGFRDQRALNGDAPAIENAVLASRLDIILRLEMVQRLDLLENFDVIRRLDRLATQEG
jgi:anti-sigma factor RsiW